MGDIVRVVRRGRFLGWYIRYKDADGRRKMRASHQPTQALARRLLVEVEARVARGLFGIPEPAPPLPRLSDFLERYLTEYTRPRLKDLGRYRSEARTSLRRILPLLGDVPLDRLGKADVERARDAVARTHPANTVRATLRPLSTALSWAVKLGLLASNPVRGVELPRPESLIEFLDADEARRLLAEAERRARGSDDPELGSLRVAVALGLLAGLRRGEICGLRWSDVDIETQRLTVACSYTLAPKNNQVRHLRLPTQLVPLLREWRPRCPRTARGLVCPVRGRSGWQLARRSADRQLPSLLRDAGCKDLVRPWHALRHTFASHFIMSGGNVLTLQRILGHADIKMTLIYAHLAPDYLGVEMDRVKF